MRGDPGRERRGLLLVVSSPSGAGKTSLARRLVADHPSLELSVSATTRAPRPGERDGREYRFIEPAEFERLAREEAFLELAQVHEHRYGSPRAPVVAALARGRDMLFDVDWQGAGAIAQSLPGDTVRVFVLPPSMDELARRLHSRAQDAEDVIARRLGRAKGEIARWEDYDYVILNDDFETAYAQLEAIYQAERLKRVRNRWVEGLVTELMEEPPPSPSWVGWPEGPGGAV